MAGREGARVIALDWGSTSCRAYLLDENAVPLAYASSDEGVLAVSAGTDPGPQRAAAYEAALHRLCEDWVKDGSLPIIACGMVGSDQGWATVPYASLPLDLCEPAFVLEPVQTRFGTMHIVPGVESTGTAPDVIRGEETQLVAGMLELIAAGGADGDNVFVLPGTHSKWARTSGTRLVEFRTWMTGEMYALVREHSIVGRAAQPSKRADWGAFDAGVERARAFADDGILGTLFSTRALVLANKLSPRSVDDYLSGLMIGAETVSVVQGWLGGHAGPIRMSGSAVLSERYERALSALNVTTVRASPDATASALGHLAERAGLVTRSFEESR